MRKVIIAETGHAPADLPERFGHYGDMTHRMVSDAGFRADTSIVKVYDGGTLPPPSGGEALIITGSPAGVYEDHDWIPPLEDAVRAHIATGNKVVGICFGHQLMAQALGGEVEKSPKGWGVGLQTNDVAGGAMPWGEGPQRFACAVSHQDQVVRLPDGATRLAGSAFCPYGTISYAGGRGLSFQMHPEFVAEFGLALLEARLDRIPQEVADLARASYRGASDRGEMARWISNFLMED